MAQDYLRPAAVKAGILTEGDRRRFGFHNLRHSLASYLVTQTKTDIKTVQAMLRHADSGTTLDLYTHAINRDKLVTQNQIRNSGLRYATQTSTVSTYHRTERQQLRPYRVQFLHASYLFHR